MHVNFSHHTIFTLPFTITDSTINSLSYEHSAAVQYNRISTSNNVGGVGKERNKAFTLLLGFVNNDSSADSIF